MLHAENGRAWRMAWPGARAHVSDVTPGIIASWPAGRPGIDLIERGRHVGCAHAHTATIP